MLEIKIPAKVMLSGEYAVLYGGTAVLMPVPRRLSLKEDKRQNPEYISPVIESALNYIIEEIEEFEVSNGKPSVVIDSSDFYAIDAEGKTKKLGLGLSASESVGIVALRLERAEINWLENRELVASYADEIHNKVQDGKGSGADIYACALGERIKFSFKDGHKTAELIKTDNKNSETPLNLVWSGESADTRVLVDKFRSWRESNEYDSDLLRRFVESADKLSEFWFRESLETLYNGIDQFDDLITEIADRAGFEYKLPFHRDISKWAQDHGGRAKPTGAGGGDMVLLIGDLPVEELGLYTIKLT